MKKNKQEDTYREPFEGLLGDTCELRVLEFMIPLKDCLYTTQEIADMIKSSRREVNIAMEKFVKWGVMNKTSQKYSINYGSSILESINNFNLSLIDAIIKEQEGKTGIGARYGKE